MLFLLVFGGWGIDLAAQITLDASFENGNLEGWSANGLDITVGTNLPPGGWSWLHFRATGVLGLQPRFRTPTTASGDVYRSYHRMVWRPASETQWRFLANGSRPGDGYYHFSHDRPFAEDVVYIAYWFPYTTNDLATLIAGLRMQNLPHVTSIAPFGSSREGRALWRYEIEEPSPAPHGRHAIVVIGRQHGYESLGNFVIEGMTAFLLSADPVAVAARSRARFLFYPMANPDAVFHGWTREGLDRTGLSRVDFNRDWRRSSAARGGIPSQSYEIDALREDIVARTGGRATVTIDVHSHAKGSSGLGWYWWYQGDGVLARQIVTSAWRFDRDRNGGLGVFSWPNPTPSSNPAGTTAMHFGASFPHTPEGTLQGLGLTLEPIAAPFGVVHDQARLRAGGESIVRALVEHLEPRLGSLIPSGSRSRTAR